VEAW